MSDYNLNDVQCQAVSTTKGALLIVAGAGSGKTRVLIWRIGYLITMELALPSEILAITFTNKAAQEMKDRLINVFGTVGKEVWVSTFHALCARMLRQQITHLGYKTNFTILEPADQIAIIRECYRELNIRDTDIHPRQVQAAISHAKNKLLRPSAYMEQVNTDILHQIANVYQMYQQRLQIMNTLDFDDLLVLTVQLLTQQPELLAFYQERFQYIHVDEYQDTNYAQYKLCRLLSAQHENICVVGDSDQSIYGWRGADITNILSFEQDYTKATTITLEQNYRSTQNILQAANEVIKVNPNRKPKQLWTAGGKGEKIKIYQADDEWAESKFIQAVIQNHCQNDQMKYQDHAVLYRSKAQARFIEEELLQAKIPYQMVSGIAFYERKEVKDMVAYLRLIWNQDDDASFTRMINVPKRGIGMSTLKKLKQIANTEGISLMGVLAQREDIPLSSTKKETLSHFYDMIRTLQQASKELTVTELTKKILEVTEYREKIKQEDMWEERIETIEDFFVVMSDFEKYSEDSSLPSFLTDVALVTDIDKKTNQTEPIDRVRVMTIHSAKGLEFPIVFVMGMEEGILPHHYTLEKEEEIEEERRLAYVAITRAKRELYLTYAEKRKLPSGEKKETKPSRFLGDIPKEVKEVAQYPRPNKEIIDINKRECVSIQVG